MNEPRNDIKYSNQVHGVDNHIFHPQFLERVSGRLAEPAEVGINGDDYRQILRNCDKPLGESGENLLTTLRLKPIAGLPLSPDTEATYLQDNTLSIATKSSEASVRAVAYPAAGRAVTLTRGWIAENGQVLRHQNIKGVGKTLSVGAKYKKESPGPTNDVGVSREVETDVRGTNMARKSGVLTPVIFPPIIYQEIFIDNNIHPSDIDPDPRLCIQRGWISDVRLTALFRSKNGVNLSYDDFDLMLDDVELTIKVFQSRIKSFLTDCKKVDEFNKDNQTSYSMGCGDYLEGQNDFKSYAEAFRKQMVKNIKNMIEGNIYHDNFSMQNLSIAGEIGDWDAINYSDENGDLVDSNTNMIRSRGSESFQRRLASLAFFILLRSYSCVEMIASVFSPESLISFESWWNMIEAELQPGNWAKTLSLDKLITSGISQLSQDRARQDIYKGIQAWETLFKKLADSVATESALMQSTD